MVKEIRKYLLVCILIALAIHILNFLATGFEISFLWQWKQLLVNYTYACIIGIANIWFFKFLNKKGSWEKQPKKMLMYGVTGSVLVSTLSFFIARLVHKLIFENYSFSEFMEMEHVGNYIFSMLIAFIVTLLFHLFYFFKALQEAKVKEQKIISYENSAKLSALKNQLDPHFLFNSLNVLTSLIEENPEKAQDFTTGLSKIYRYVLEQKEQELVSLASEINFAYNYINLLKMRFEDSVQFQVEVESQQAYYLIPLSLQLLLENAVKHNVISENLPLRIAIYTSAEMLVVENTYQPKKQLDNRIGVGLKNIKDRYKLATDKAVQIEQEGSVFKVQLPLLIKK